MCNVFLLPPYRLAVAFFSSLLFSCWEVTFVAWISKWECRSFCLSLFIFMLFFLLSNLERWKSVAWHKAHIAHHTLHITHNTGRSWDVQWHHVSHSQYRVYVSCLTASSSPSLSMTAFLLPLEKRRGKGGCSKNSHSESQLAGCWLL